jgi:hypothetical protein
MSERLRLADELLQEVVFASRAKQAAGLSLRLAREKDGSSPTNCGLGREAALELGLSERGQIAFETLWPAPATQDQAQRIRAVLARWVERADQLDRDRNHFLKAFRTKHGFDRRAYGAELAAQLERGLTEVNERVEAERRSAALELLGPTA